MRTESLPEGFSTGLWMGHKPKTLNLIKQVGVKELIGLPLNKGLVYWQVRAERGDEKIRTPIFKTEILTLYPPAPLQPLNQGVVRLRHSEEKTTLKWFKHQEFNSVTVEIVAPEDNQKSVFRDNLSTNEISLNLAPSKYQWRLVGNTKYNNSDFASDWYSFEVSVRSQINIGLKWTENTQSMQNFVGEIPMLNLQWSATNENFVRNYRVRVWPENQTHKSGTVQTVTDKLFSVRLQESGRYLTSIEALDDEGENLGSTGQRRFEVKPLPLLPPLRLESSQKNNWIESDDEGNIKLVWNNLDEAQSYVLKLADKKGDKIIDEVTMENEKSLTDLLPGNYDLVLFAMDKYGRPGEKKHWTVIVPEPTQLIMPKIKKREVE